jgi:formamidopyrimidine-DNA glycosylase
MPELPEVETVRRGLHHLITGYRIADAADLHPRALKAESIAPLASLRGARITGTGRRGKFMWIALDRPFVLVAHLGMSGQFLIQEKDRPRAKHIRARFELKRSLRKLDLVFNDQRTFGWLSVEELTDGVPSSAAHIAYDPFDPHFDYQATIAKIAKRNIRIKTALLNQEIMSGVGNIYADEALWRAKVHPELMTSEMTSKKIASVIDSATEVMREAIAQGGTSFDDLYINVNGESGFFEQSLSAYGREDQPCPRCGALIKRIVFGARSSHFCPRCQSSQRSQR